ncbi:Elongator complex protein 4 [Halotydeus destructor]|nr:Elongator complex protein 4 [Halotydeus destructor]
MSTSFVKSQKRGFDPSKTLSSGIPSLDDLIGGVSRSCLILLEEDEFEIYSNIFLKLFISEGLYSGESVLLSGNSLEKFDDIMKQLPTRTLVQPESRPSSEPNHLKIAWRYADTPSNDDSTNQKHQYDLGAIITDQEITQLSLKTDLIQQVEFADISSTLAKSEQSVRAIVKNLTSCVSEKEIAGYLFKLKSVVKKNQGICVVSINSHVLPHETLARLHNISDCAIELNAFHGQNASYPDYDGTLSFHKLPKINALSNPKNIETLDLGFQMKKQNRFFIVDKLCLPPELGDTPSRSTCSTSNKNFDF